MKIDPRCIPWNMSALVRILSQNGVKREEQLVAAGLFLKDMAEMDLEAETPIEIGRNVGKALKAVMGEIDAFREVKKAADDLLIEVYNELKEKLRALEDPLIGALKLSVAGNIIDFAPGHRIDIDSTMRQALAAPFAIDDLEELSERIKGAKS
ncbi:MAG: ARMT1-like domain-containing protein, partial [Mesotoga sp.]|nr:ARMT1-like domain-containing protein [Mesotoga sp.]